MNTSSLGFSNVEYLNVKTGFCTVFPHVRWRKYVMKTVFVYLLCAMMIILSSKKCRSDHEI